MDVERNVKQAAADVDNFLTTGSYYVDPDAVVQRVQAPKATKSDFLRYFSKWENLKILIGASYSWFALDVSCPFSPIRTLPLTRKCSRLRIMALDLTRPLFCKL